MSNFDIVRQAFVRLRGHWRDALLVSLIAYLPSLLLGLVPVFRIGLLDDADILLAAGDASRALAKSTEGLILILLWLALILGFAFLDLGRYAWADKRIRGEEPPVREVFSQRWQTGKVALIIVLIVLTVFGALFAAVLLDLFVRVAANIHDMTLPLLIAVGLVALWLVILWANAYVALVRHPELTAVQAMRTSRQAVKGRFFRFVLFLLCAGLPVFLADQLIDLLFARQPWLRFALSAVIWICWSPVSVAARCIWWQSHAEPELPAESR